MTGASGSKRVVRHTPVLLVLVVAALGVALSTAGCSSTRQQDSSQSAAVGCIAARGAQERDLDESDDPEHAWAHTPGQRVTVYFQTEDLPPRYRSMVERGAQIWSKSRCISAVAIDQCPSQSNCSTVVIKKHSDDDDTDGESSGRDKHGVREDNKIVYYSELLDKATDNGALATVVHEMGHALGLVHRLDKNDVMNSDTDNDTNPIPDAADFDNLAVIYGAKQ